MFNHVAVSIGGEPATLEDLPELPAPEEEPRHPDTSRSWTWTARGRVVRASTTSA